MIKNQAITVCYVAWNTSTNQGQPGDAANHTLRAVGDGAEFTPSASPVQVDATNLPGVYKLALLASEANYNAVLLGGISSTSGVVIYPVQVTTDRGLVSALNAAAQLATGLAITGVVAASPAPSASAFTVTLDAALSGLETAGDLVGRYCTFRAGGRQTAAMLVTACTINSTTSVALTFASPNVFAAAPAAGDAVTISS